MEDDERDDNEGVGRQYERQRVDETKAGARSDDNDDNDDDGRLEDASIVASDYDTRDGPALPPLAREEGEAQECRCSRNERRRHRKQ